MFFSPEDEPQMRGLIRGDDSVIDENAGGLEFPPRFKLVFISKIFHIQEFTQSGHSMFSQEFCGSVSAAPDGNDTVIADRNF